MFAPSVARPTTGLMSWLPSPVTNDLTIVSRRARAASFSNVEPKNTPGIEVGISPVTLQALAGLPIIGSNVSNCDGPPCMKRKIGRESIRQTLVEKRGFAGTRHADHRAGLPGHSAAVGFPPCQLRKTQVRSVSQLLPDCLGDAIFHEDRFSRIPVFCEDCFPASFRRADGTSGCRAGLRRGRLVVRVCDGGHCPPPQVINSGITRACSTPVSLLSRPRWR